jgi:serine/threonine-protein kinase HipA
LDRLTFLKANLVFWLLGATDGHAKNFSVFLYPGGGFRPTPLYDVISAQPSFDAKHVRHKDFKLAMALGKARHYGILGVHRRHFVETAELAGLSPSTGVSLIEEVIEASPKAIHRAVSKCLRTSQARSQLRSFTASRAVSRSSPRKASW